MDKRSVISRDRQQKDEVMKGNLLNKFGGYYTRNSSKDQSSKGGNSAQRSKMNCPLSSLVLARSDWSKLTTATNSFEGFKTKQATTNAGNNAEKTQSNVKKSDWSKLTTATNSFEGFNTKQATTDACSNAEKTQSCVSDNSSQENEIFKNHEPCEESQALLEDCSSGEKLSDRNLAETIIDEKRKTLESGDFIGIEGIKKEKLDHPCSKNDVKFHIENIPQDTTEIKLKREEKEEDVVNTVPQPIAIIDRTELQKLQLTSNQIFTSTENDIARNGTVMDRNEFLYNLLKSNIIRDTAEQITDTDDSEEQITDTDDSDEQIIDLDDSDEQITHSSQNLDNEQTPLLCFPPNKPSPEQVSGIDHMITNQAVGRAGKGIFISNELKEKLANRRKCENEKANIGASKTKKKKIPTIIRNQAMFKDSDESSSDSETEMYGTDSDRFVSGNLSKAVDVMKSSQALNPNVEIPLQMQDHKSTSPCVKLRKLNSKILKNLKESNCANVSQVNAANDGRTCNYCDKIFTQKITRVKHEQFNCRYVDIPQNVLDMKVNLPINMPKERFPCKFCNNKYSSKDSRKKHENFHCHYVDNPKKVLEMKVNFPINVSRDRLVPCKYCNHKYSNENSRIRHEKLKCYLIGNPKITPKRKDNCQLKGKLANKRKCEYREANVGTSKTKIQKVFFRNQAMFKDSDESSSDSETEMCGTDSDRLTSGYLLKTAHTIEVIPAVNSDADIHLQMQEHESTSPCVVLNDSNSEPNDIKEEPVDPPVEIKVSLDQKPESNIHLQSQEHESTHPCVEFSKSNKTQDIILIKEEQVNSQVELSVSPDRKPDTIVENQIHSALNSADENLKESNCRKIPRVNVAKDGMYSCKYCNKLLKLKRNQVLHEKFHCHAVDNPWDRKVKFHCKYCSKQFVTKYSKARHEKCHSFVNTKNRKDMKVNYVFKVKLFPCNYCNKKFTTNHKRKKHERLSCNSLDNSERAPIKKVNLQLTSARHLTNNKATVTKNTELIPQDIQTDLVNPPVERKFSPDSPQDIQTDLINPPVERKISPDSPQDIEPDLVNPLVERKFSPDSPQDIQTDRVNPPVERKFSSDSHVENLNVKTAVNSGAENLKESTTGTNIPQVNAAAKDRRSCNYCHKIFSARKGRERHEKFHCPSVDNLISSLHMGVKFPCKFCGNKFAREGYRRTHEMFHCRSSDNPEAGVNRKVKFACKYCDRTLSSRSHKMRHERLSCGSSENSKGIKVSKERTIPCRYCNIKFTEEFCRRRHERFHCHSIDNPKKFNGSENGKFPCGYCDKIFTQEYSRRQHERFNCHSIDNPKKFNGGSKNGKFPCGYCDKTFQHNASRMKHLQRNCHSNKALKVNYHCVTCFWNSTSLKKPEEKFAKCGTGICCKYCGKRFAKFSGKFVHEKEHRLMTDFQCKLCFKYFSSAESEQMHELLHSADNPLKCQLCPKYFTSIRMKDKHSHPDVTCRCRFCEFKFHNEIARESHEIVHDSRTEFQCKTCLKYFMDSNTRSVHEAKHTDK